MNAVHARLDAISHRLTADLDPSDVAALVAFVKDEHLGCCCSLYSDTLACIPTENRLKRGIQALARGESFATALQLAKRQFLEVAP